MWMVGYWMERGYRPEFLLNLSRSDKNMFTAIAQLNQEEQLEMIKKSFIEAAVFILQKIKG